MPDQDNEQAAGSRDAQLIAESKKRFKQCEDAERELRDLALDDLKFRAGDQWPEQIKNRMVQERKPALTINVLPARERLILNEQRQNRPAIKVSPVDDQADPDTAEVLQGIIRHIEYDSDADVAYDTAIASAVRCGFGYVRLITEYEDEESFQEVIKIKRVNNPFQVYLDPSAQEADACDAEFGFVFERLTKEEYKQLYPEGSFASIEDWGSTGTKDPDWISEEGIRIVEYFYKEHKKDTLYQLKNRAGETRTALKSEVGKIPKGVKVLQEREVDICTVKWCKHDAEGILDEAEWAGSYVPIIPVYGDELYVDGHKILEGMVRHAKDPMRMQNYMASKEVQAIALAPNAPFIAASGQIENHPEWKTANVDNFSVLTYEPIANNGTAVPPPQRNTAEPPIQAITVARAHFMNDFEQVTGIYQAQQGAPSNETSGRAVLQRKTQGELANFNYIDNGTRMRRGLGRQLIELIQKKYTAPMMIRTLGEDDVAKVVKVNQQWQQENGTSKHYQIGTGRYDVIVSDGPSFLTRKQEAQQGMIEFLKIMPAAAQVTGDLVADAMDWPKHEEFAKRLRVLVPPQAFDQQDPKEAAQALQAENFQLKQQLQQMGGEMGQLGMEKQAKVIEMQFRKQMNDDNNEVKLAIAAFSAKMASMQQGLDTISSAMKDLHIAAHDSAHEMAMQKDQQAHEHSIADKQFQTASLQSAQDHEQALQQGAQTGEQQTNMAKLQAKLTPKKSSAASPKR